MAGKGIYILSEHILTPLGSGTAPVLEALRKGHTGVRISGNYRGQDLCASLFEPAQWDSLRNEFGESYSPFEQLLLHSIGNALEKTGVDPANPRTLLLIASTKGNIGLLQPGMESAHERTALHLSAAKVGAALHYHSTPMVVSNACISGMTALLVAKRMMEAGLYDHAIVAGADIISPFIVAGFRSFQAMSDEVCRPFDANRKGINLGEAAATIVLGTRAAQLQLTGGATSSDANHISGPSRTGAEMAQAICTAMKQAGIAPRELGFISAHGTATPFNDEMESKAFSEAGLEAVPAFSLKAYFGHTLGAAGLLESAVSLEALRQDTVIGSKGYSTHGVTRRVNIARETYVQKAIKHILKTGSGFGGCNAALVFSKNN